ncbi:ABC transporter permease [Propylenella binzhouense]|uniref:ABC transporter permease n=1 Tax=Propylenella binzhouense TaxID=2555902 RepID=UPI0031B5BD5A
MDVASGADAGLRIAAVASLAAAWEIAVRLLRVPHFILPAPSEIAGAFAAEPGFFLRQSLITGGEMLVGMALGVGLGIACALLLALSPRLERVVGPMLVVSQALPVFAIAPLLVIWFGFGLSSKVAMAALIIFFPVATTFADGLRRADPNLLDLARMNGAGRVATLWKIRVPSALPALGSGLRIAAAVAPIGAVVGEWVGSSSGLGFIMLQSNARMQTDRVFVALFILAGMAVLLRLGVDLLVRRRLAWVPGEGSTR